MDRERHVETRERLRCSAPTVAELASAAETDPATAAALTEWWSHRSEKGRRGHDARVLIGDGSQAEISSTVPATCCASPVSVSSS